MVSMSAEKYAVSSVSSFLDELYSVAELSEVEERVCGPSVFYSIIITNI